MHDTGDKVVLGQTIKGGGIEDGERVLDLLARHPSTARFIATKLARRFVADEPPASLVERARRQLSVHRRRPARGGAGDRDVAGVLRRREPARQGQDPVRVRRLGAAGHRRRRADTPPLARDAAAAGHAPLSLPAPDGVQGHGRRVGQQRRAHQSHELRGGAGESRRRVARSTRCCTARRPTRRARPSTRRRRRRRWWRWRWARRSFSDGDG